jgi:hypothetical protein
MDHLNFRSFAAIHQVKGVRHDRLHGIIANAIPQAQADRNVVGRTVRGRTAEFHPQFVS